MPGIAIGQVPAAKPQDAVRAEPEAKPRDPSIVELDTMVVSGAQPGPGMWRVSKGDHVLWILGTQSPLPRRMEWDTTAVERTILQSQELIAPPGTRIKSDIGFFSGLTLIPSAFKAPQSRWPLPAAGRPAGPVRALAGVEGEIHRP
ncbi:TraB/GumN family protein [Luteimonas cucumeris]|nr:TraB/GumN family protein [Luteimonas cucumeris]